MGKGAKIILGIVAIALLFGGYYFVKNNSKTNTTQTAKQTVQTLSDADLGLSMDASPDKKKVHFKISKTSDIQSIVYQITYESDSHDKEKASRVQHGITGGKKINGSSTAFESPWYDLGTCVKGVCTYDTGVTSVSLSLQIVKTDGKKYTLKKTIKL